MNYTLSGFNRKKHTEISALCEKLKSELPKWAVESPTFEQLILIIAAGTHPTKKIRNLLKKVTCCEFIINPARPTDGIVEIFSILLSEAMQSNEAILRAFTLHFSLHQPPGSIGGNEVYDPDILLFCRHLVLYILDPKGLIKEMPLRHEFVENFLQLNISNTPPTHVLQ